MNHHNDAWTIVQSHIFGSVCEVARTTPWGFKEDMEEIHNVSVNEFLKSDSRYDTIILHILSGEGSAYLKECIKHAYDLCVKLIVLEHNPNHKDWEYDTNVTWDRLSYIEQLEKVYGEKVIKEDWGRNILYACTTMAPFHLPQLNNKYYNKHINESYVRPHDEGIDKKHLIYTHTSESPIDFELPEGTIYWVAGGGLAFEAMESSNNNILIDSVLRQCIYWSKQSWKTDRLYTFEGIKIDEDYKQWRVIKHNNIQPDSIQHIPLQDLKCKDSTVYVSTVHKNYWKHLVPNNNIIDAWTERDKPCLIKK
jgi:hypothetical protein